MAFLYWFYDFQTLVAGVLAVIAAAFAGAPIWKQLAMMRAQTEAGFRQTVVDRLNETATRTAHAKALVTQSLNDVGRHIENYDFDRVPEVDPQWAHHQDQVIGWVRVEFAEWSASHRDVEPIEAAKAIVIEKLEALEKTLFEIHRPDSVGMTDDENTVSDVMMQEWEEASTAARGALQMRNSAAFQSLRALEDAYRNLRDGLNLRLRSIDDQIIGINSARSPRLRGVGDMFSALNSQR